MKNRPIVLFLSILCILVSQTSSQDWKISDYLKNLPKEYKVYSGDFSTPTDETILIDEKNGYAAYYDQPLKNEYAVIIFEMTIFKKANGEQILVVSNLKSDPVCNEYQTFFLQRSGENWIDVKTKVLPILSPQIFFDSANTAAGFLAIQKKIGNSTDLDLHFSPPREGTMLKVNLEICDYVPDEFSDEINFQTFIDKSTSISLIWDKQKGIFKLK